MIKKVLIVEDEIELLDLLLIILGENEEYRMLTARDGEEALRIARVENPDIVILDFLLPQMNGFDVCKLIKSDPAISSTRIMMLSGMAQHFDQLKAHEVGVDAYIAKPFRSVVLIEKVEELLKDNH